MSGEFRKIFLTLPVEQEHVVAVFVDAQEKEYWTAITHRPEGRIKAYWKRV